MTRLVWIFLRTTTYGLATDKLSIEELIDCESVLNLKIVSNASECDSTHHNLSSPFLAHTLNASYSRCSYLRMQNEKSVDSATIKATLQEWRKVDSCLTNDCKQFACQTGKKSTQITIPDIKLADLCIFEADSVAGTLYEDFIRSYVLIEEFCMDLHLFDILFQLEAAPTLSVEVVVANLRARLFDLLSGELPSHIRRCGASEFCRNHAILLLPLTEYERLEDGFAFAGDADDLHMIISLLHFRRALRGVPLAGEDLLRPKIKSADSRLISRTRVRRAHNDLIQIYRKMVLKNSSANLSPEVLLPINERDHTQSPRRIMINLQNALRTFPSLLMGSKTMIDIVDQSLTDENISCAEKLILRNILVAEGRAVKILYATNSASRKNVKPLVVTRIMDPVASSYLESGFVYLDSSTCATLEVSEPNSRTIRVIDQDILGSKSQYRALYYADQDYYNLNPWSPVFRSRYDVETSDVMIQILSSIYTYCSSDTSARLSFIAQVVSLASTKTLEQHLLDPATLRRQMSRIENFWGRYHIADEAQGTTSITGIIARGITILTEVLGKPLESVLVESYFDNLSFITLYRQQHIGCLTITRNLPSISDRNLFQMMWAEEIKYSANRGTLGRSDCIILAKALGVTRDLLPFAGIVLAVAEPWKMCLNRFPDTITPLMDATFDFLMIETMKVAGSKKNSVPKTVDLGVKNLLIPRYRQSNQLRDILPRYWALGFNKEVCDVSAVTQQYESRLYNQIRERLPLSQGFCEDSEQLASMLQPAEEKAADFKSQDLLSECASIATGSLASRRIAHVIQEVAQGDYGAPMESGPVRYNLNRIGALVASKGEHTRHRLSFLCHLHKDAPEFAGAIHPWVYARTGKVIIDRREPKPEYWRWDRLFPRNHEYIDLREQTQTAREIDGIINFSLGSALPFIIGMGDVLDAFNAVSEDDAHTICCNVLQWLEYAANHLSTPIKRGGYQQDAQGSLVFSSAQELITNEIPNNLFLVDSREFVDAPHGTRFLLALEQTTAAIDEIWPSCNTLKEFAHVNIHSISFGFEFELFREKSEEFREHFVPLGDNDLADSSEKADRAFDALRTSMIQSEKICENAPMPRILRRSGTPRLSNECIMITRQAQQQLSEISKTLEPNSFASDYVKSIQRLLITYLMLWPMEEQPCASLTFHETIRFLITLATDAFNRPDVDADFVLRAIYEASQSRTDEIVKAEIRRKCENAKKEAEPIWRILELQWILFDIKKQGARKP